VPKGYKNDTQGQQSKLDLNWSKLVVLNVVANRNAEVFSECKTEQLIHLITTVVFSFIMQLFCRLRRRGIPKPISLGIEVPPGERLRTIGVSQWFLNFFEHDPNLSFMNISRPKPQTSKKCIFNVSTLPFFQISMK